MVCLPALRCRPIMTVQGFYPAPNPRSEESETTRRTKRKTGSGHNPEHSVTFSAPRLFCRGYPDFQRAPTAGRSKEKERAVSNPPVWNSGAPKVPAYVE